MASRQLTLKRYEAVQQNFNKFSAYRMRVETSNVVDMDGHVFVYRRDPTSPYADEPLDTFFTIASPVDMAEYPVDAPDSRKAFPFFRKNFVELDFRSTALAAAAWELIVQEVTTLIHALNRLEDLNVVQEVHLGPFHDDDLGTGSLSVSESGDV